MVSRHPRRGSGNGPDDAGRDPAVDRVLRAARDTGGEIDTVTLEATLAAYRVAGEAGVADPEPPVRVTRRHRVLRALAATTIATKVVLGVATAAALGGIGVAVTETVHHAPGPVRPSSTAPPAPPSSAPGTGTGTGSGAPTGPASSPSPSQATDSGGTTTTRSPSPSGSGSGSGSASPSRSASGSRSASSSRSASGSRSPDASGRPTRTASPDPTR